jgi:hypothetical protein
MRNVPCADKHQQQVRCRTDILLYLHAEWFSRRDIVTQTVDYLFTKLRHCGALQPTRTLVIDDFVTIHAREFSLKHFLSHGTTALFDRCANSPTVSAFRGRYSPLWYAALLCRFFQYASNSKSRRE